MLSKTLNSKKTAEELFAYFSDFTTTNEWDPNTVKTTKLSGDGGVGTKYSNTSAFNGRESSLVYEVIEYRANSDRKSTRLNSSHIPLSRMPSSA